jgi:hypothetical protein
MAIVGYICIGVAAVVLIALALVVIFVVNAKPGDFP